MKKIIVLIICNLFVLNINAQFLNGAWESEIISKSDLPDEGIEKDEKFKYVVIFGDGYHTKSVYKSETGEFLWANGGSWVQYGDTMIEKIEFDSNSPDEVGKEYSLKINLDHSSLVVTHPIGGVMKFKRIDSGKPGKLYGSWLMAGRVRDGKRQMRDTDRPRKTMKILSGTRFQWIAYNTETKQFMGTGGGTYTTINGEYVENIEFFSRDGTKAGLSLKFNHELTNNEWNHKGFSSKGDPMHEIWVKRK